VIRSTGHAGRVLSCAVQRRKKKEGAEKKVGAGEEKGAATLSKEKREGGVILINKESTSTVKLSLCNRHGGADSSN